MLLPCVACVELSMGVQCQVTRSSVESGDQVPGPGRLGSQTSSHWSTPHSTLKLDADMARVRSYVDKP